MSNPAQHLLERLAIHQICTPNSSSNIETNCYFINDSVPTLIDTGIASSEAYEALSAALSEHRRSVADIKRILLTHGHADHRALAPRIQAESGAEIYYHHAERSRVTGAPSSGKDPGKEIEFFHSLGVPHDLAVRLVDGPEDPAIKPRAPSAIALSGGEEFLFDAMALNVIHTPGHSGGSICFLDNEHDLLFTGDTLLPTSRITAFIELEVSVQNADYNPLNLHLESLERLEMLGPKQVLPGHGDPFHGCSIINGEVRERHRKRRTHILRALRHGPKTLYQICRSVFLFNSDEDLYLALSDVLGNVGILHDEGKVRQRRDGRHFLYEII